MNEIEVVQICENCDPFWELRQMSEDELKEHLEWSRKNSEYFDSMPLDPAVIPAYDENGNELPYKGN